MLVHGVGHILILTCPSLFSTEAFDLVLRHGRNSTLSLLKSEFSGLGSGVHSLVGQLYMDMSLYILGSDSSVNHMRLLGGSASPSVSEECLKGAWKDSGAFGPYPKLLMTRLSRSLLATRVFLQALNLGIEVVNTTDHLRPGRDCSRSLLRLWYCPHCQGQLEPVACKGLCQAVMQGCLGALWRCSHTGGRTEFISSLRSFISFYSGLGEALCSREPPSANSSLCWNGHEMTDRFSGPGLKRSHPGPETRNNNNKPPEPVISQIIDKLKHINQVRKKHCALIHVMLINYTNQCGPGLKPGTLCHMLHHSSTTTNTSPSAPHVFSSCGLGYLFDIYADWLHAGDALIPDFINVLD
ncbi:hypothetical protein WMY93_020327 [Mugilogobius chulae]|uniref:Glypican-3 n=1 Tax=Mugilogobius chulae TaxID=88201 RepID=A0AAW0NL35_9GOBI